MLTGRSSSGAALARAELWDAGTPWYDLARALVAHHTMVYVFSFLVIAGIVLIYRMWHLRRAVRESWLSAYTEGLAWEPAGWQWLVVGLIVATVVPAALFGSFSRGLTGIILGGASAACLIAGAIIFTIAGRRAAMRNQREVLRRMGVDRPTEPESRDERKQLAEHLFRDLPMDETDWTSLTLFGRGTYEGVPFDVYEFYHARSNPVVFTMPIAGAKGEVWATADDVVSLQREFTRLNADDHHRWRLWTRTVGDERRLLTDEVVAWLNHWWTYPALRMNREEWRVGVRDGRVLVMKARRPKSWQYPIMLRAAHELRELLVHAVRA